MDMTGICPNAPLIQASSPRLHVLCWSRLQFYCQRQLFVPPGCNPPYDIRQHAVLLHYHLTDAMMCFVQGILRSPDFVGEAWACDAMLSQTWSSPNAQVRNMLTADL